ncbi:hypothetical protein K8R47_02515, partial [archaeon]|nr:hypothetical protein [archaeon]
MVRESNNQIKELKNQITSLKKQLNDLNNEKEIWFKKKEDLKKEINSEIFKIKGIKNKKDKSNIDFRTVKQERDNHNAEVKKLITQIKKLNDQKLVLFKKHNIKGDPSRTVKQIEVLEFKIETEALSLSQEKKVMKQI